MKPDIIPIPADHQTFAASQPAVMPTRPASNPLHIAATLSTLSTSIFKMKAVNPPHAALMHVFIHTIWISSWLSPVAPSADPPLNPNQPNHNTIVPRQTKPTL
eukprot:NODE_431_length_1677_cov_401.248771_g336_i0.p2 GENE.NODE_431_length_1677_cov_401.248771_g336_i0~~NODE_431_length_1677_cov_401.248771_g336_i0.p2  ORF type:complete len:103 (-),score=4.26 NODE_431_length_1677_cov_401.248771_g336_i0:699-1007(-)